MHPAAVGGLATSPDRDQQVACGVDLQGPTGGQVVAGGITHN